MPRLTGGRAPLLFLLAVVATLIVQTWASVRVGEGWTTAISGLTAGFYGVFIVHWALRNRDRFWRYYAGFVSTCVGFIALQGWGRWLDGRVPFRTEHPFLATVWTFGLLLLGAVTWSVLRRVPAPPGRRTVP